MSDPIFTPSDFEKLNFHSVDWFKECAEIANRKLNSLLGPEVRHGNNGAATWIVMDEGQRPHPLDTHRARLFDVQEIVKEKCVEHVPKLQSRQPVGLPDCDDRYGAALILGCSIVCAKCGVRLTPEWKEIEGE